MKTRITYRTSATLVAAALTACSPARQSDTGYPAATVLYAATSAPQDMRLFLADGDGRNERALPVAAGYDYNAALSADGTWVVFTSEREGSADLFRVRVDGSGLERLTDHPAFDDAGVLSPDGKSVAFVSTREGGNANIWLLDLASRKFLNLTAGSPGDFRPTWSPDSESIAFSSIRDVPYRQPNDDPAVDPRRFPASSLYVVRRDGSDLKRMTTSGYVFGPRWSTDGQRIVAIEMDPSELQALASAFFTSRSERDAIIARIASSVVAINVADGRATELVQARGLGALRFPQDLAGSRAVYSTPGGIGFSNGEAGAEGLFESPSWSAEGGMMVFHRNLEPTGGFALGSSTAFKLRASLDPAFYLLRTGDFPSHRPLSGGTEIAMGHPLATTGLRTVSPDGTASRELFRDPQRAAGAPAVSPDGLQIAFGLGARGFISDGGPSVLALIRPDGSGFRELTTAGDHAGYPSWSPDGRRLVYMRGSPAEARGLYILEVSTGHVTRLTTGSDNFPDWSPSGDRIAFTRATRGLAGASQLYSIRPDGTEETRLTLSPGAQDAHPAWSPDGNWIAFTSARLNPRQEVIGAFGAHHGIGQIYVMRADGSDIRQLTDNIYNTGTPAWLPTPY